MPKKSKPTVSLRDQIATGSLADLKNAMDDFRPNDPTITTFIAWHSLMQRRFEAVELCVNDGTHGPVFEKVFHRFLFDILSAGDLEGLKFMAESPTLTRHIDPSVADRQAMSLCSCHPKGGDILRFMLPRMKQFKKDKNGSFGPEAHLVRMHLISDAMTYKQPDTVVALMEFFGPEDILPSFTFRHEFLDGVFALSTTSIKEDILKVVADREISSISTPHIQAYKDKQELLKASSPKKKSVGKKL